MTSEVKYKHSVSSGGGGDVVGAVEEEEWLPCIVSRPDSRFLSDGVTSLHHLAMLPVQTFVQTFVFPC